MQAATAFLLAMPSDAEVKIWVFARAVPAESDEARGLASDLLAPSEAAGWLKKHCKNMRVVEVHRGEGVKSFRV